jgi:hypothetical protein
VVFDLLEFLCWLLDGTNIKIVRCCSSVIHR